MRPPPRFWAASASSPAAMRLSLFASARSTPCSSAQSVACTPAKPTTAFSTTSGCARSSSATRSPPICFSGASTSSSGVEPLAAAQSSSPGCASTISIAWRPIEPVAPRAASRFIGPVSLRLLGMPESQHEVERRRRREQQGIDAVEHPAVAAEQVPGVLHLHVALQHRLEEVAGRGREHHDEAEDDRLADPEEMVAVLVERDE